MHQRTSFIVKELIEFFSLIHINMIRINNANQNYVCFFQFKSDKQILVLFELAEYIQTGNFLFSNKSQINHKNVKSEFMRRVSLQIYFTAKVYIMGTQCGANTCSFPMDEVLVPVSYIFKLFLSINTCAKVSCKTHFKWFYLNSKNTNVLNCWVF